MSVARINYEFIYTALSLGSVNNKRNECIHYFNLANQNIFDYRQKRCIYLDQNKNNKWYTEDCSRQLSMYIVCMNGELVYNYFNLCFISYISTNRPTKAIHYREEAVLSSKIISYSDVLPQQQSVVLQPL